MTSALPDPADAEVKEAIAYAISRTVSGIVEELVARFGPERAWPADMVRLELASQRRRSPRRPGYSFDADIQAFIADRVGLVTLDDIVSTGRAQFAPKPFPSRSEVQRTIQRRLKQDRAKRVRAFPSGKARPKL